MKKEEMHNPIFMSAMLAYGLMNSMGGNNDIYLYKNFSPNNNSPNIKTYGSKTIKSFTPDEWKQQKREQGRNELCNCGSGKKYKKCCTFVSGGG